MFSVSRSTIQFRMSGAFVKSTPGPPLVLTRNEEEDLVKWLVECSKKGFPRRLENIQANSYRRRRMPLEPQQMLVRR